MSRTKSRIPRGLRWLALALAASYVGVSLAARSADERIEQLLDEVRARVPVAIDVVPELAPANLSIRGVVHFDPRMEPPTIMLSWSWSRPGIEPRVDTPHGSGVGHDVLADLDFVPICVAAWDLSHLLVTGVRNDLPVTEAWTIVAEQGADGAPRLSYRPSDADRMRGLTDAIGLIVNAFRLDVDEQDARGRVVEAAAAPVPNRLMLVQAWPSRSLHVACLTTGQNMLAAVPSCEALPVASDAEDCASEERSTWGGVRIVSELALTDPPFVATEHAFHRQLGYVYVFHAESGEDGAGRSLVLYDRDRNGSFADPEDGALLFEDEEWFDQGMHLAVSYVARGD